MTLTASPTTSAAIDHAAFGDLAAHDASVETWFTSVDHRRVGRLLTGAALLLGVAGTAVLALVSQQFDRATRGALPVRDFLGAESRTAFSFDRIWNLVHTAGPYFIVMPLFLGVATAIVPALIGGNRLAFPRLQAFVLWGYVVAAGMFIASFVVGDGPPQLDVLSTSIAQTGGSAANHATNLLIGSLMIVTIVTILGALNLVLTVVTQRRMGLRLSDVRPFAFASLVTGGILALASPVFLAGLLLLELDQHFGGTLFGSEGGARLWAHMIWLNGRPEALLLLLPVIGAIVDVVASRVSANPLGGRSVNSLLGLFGALTLTAWASDSWKLNHMVQPNSTWQSSLIGIPLGLLALVALGTLGQNAKNLKVDASLLFAVAALLLIVLGVLNIVVAAIRGVTEGNGLALWSIDQSLLVVVIIPIVGLLAAAVEFMPRLDDRRAHPGAASLGGLATLAGFAIYFLALATSAYRDDFTKSATALSAIALLGGLVAAAGVALAGLSIAGAVLSRDPKTATGSEAGL